MSAVEHIAGHTYHGRKGAVSNGFRYSVDYLLLDAEHGQRSPFLFSRNRFNLASVRDSDHGGAPKDGQGAAWARSVLAQRGVSAEGGLFLLTQPRLFGHVFNPVSFWLAYDKANQLIAVIAEVSNTFGDRHSYLCVKPDRTAIMGRDEIAARKIFHVSPFQPIEGAYRFRFDVDDAKIGIRIDLSHGEGGLVATLCGPRKPLTNTGLLWALVRRPFGARRVLTLIHWQALKLWLKGARYRTRPTPPHAEVSHSLKEAQG